MDDIVSGFVKFAAYILSITSFEVMEDRRNTSIKRWQRPILFKTFTFMIIIVLVSGNETNSLNNFRDRSTCMCIESSIASVLWGYCLECIRIGTVRDNSWKTKGFGVNFVPAQSIPRGGETSALYDELNGESDRDKTADSSKQQQQVLQPLIDTESVSLALRLTCETNRRLHHGTSSIHTKLKDAVGIQHSMGLHPSYDQNQLVHRTTNFNTPHQLTAVPHIEAANQIKIMTDFELIEERQKEEFTIFHASTPQNDSVNTSSDRTSNCLRWGPDLKLYIGTLLSAVGLPDDQDARRDATASTVSTHKGKHPASPLEDQRQLILSLTVMYLDRATSQDNLHIDPSTGQPWHPSCPYVLPQTVHRLILTATIIATKSISLSTGVDISNSLREAANSLLQSSGGNKQEISESDMKQMEEWMTNALDRGMSIGHHQYHHGNTNTQIPSDEIGQFIRKWGQTFYPARVAAHDKRNRSRIERLERFWREQATSVFGEYGPHRTFADHGHGNHVNGWEEQHMYENHRSNNCETIQHGGNQYYQSAGYETYDKTIN